MIRNHFPTFRAYVMLAKDCRPSYALVAKDCRLFRAPIFALVVVAVVYGLAPLVMQPIPLSSISATLYPRSIFACMLTSLLAAVFGGTAIAGERRNQTADFLATLPVKRIQIVTSKLIISFSMLATCGAFHARMAQKFETAAVSEVTAFLASSNWTVAMTVLSSCAACMFGVAWLFSTFSRSGPISTFASLVVTGGLYRMVTQIFRADLAIHSYALLMLTGSMWTVGVASFLVGTIYYLVRVEP
jgi:ABC-type transport system involved in multi-copper enzyme maturation permease subunit